LSEKLHEMYYNAPCKEKALMVHLFGIKYADVIKTSGYNLKEILKLAGIKESYCVEINKGINLSKYVEVKSKINI